MFVESPALFSHHCKSKQPQNYIFAVTLSVLSLFVKIKIAEYPRDQAVYFIRVETEGAPSSPPSLHDERSHEAVQQLTSHLLVE